MILLVIVGSLFTSAIGCWFAYARHGRNWENHRDKVIAWFGAAVISTAFGILTLWSAFATTSPDYVAAILLAAMAVGAAAAALSAAMSWRGQSHARKIMAEVGQPILGRRRLPDWVAWAVGTFLLPAATLAVMFLGTWAVDAMSDNGISDQAISTTVQTWMIVAAVEITGTVIYIVIIRPVLIRREAARIQQANLDGQS